LSEVKYSQTFREFVGKVKFNDPAETLLLPFPLDWPIQVGESVGKLVLVRSASAQVSFSNRAPKLDEPTNNPNEIAIRVTCNL
jgi:hypothetical protein